MPLAWQLHNAVGVKLVTFVAAWSAWWCAGCFYVDPINQRPALDIRNDSSAAVARGSDLELFAVVADPEKHDVDLSWSVFACVDASAPETCDAAPFFESEQDRIRVRVPSELTTGAALESLRVVLEGEDDHGAAARPAQQLVVPVTNAPPSLELRRQAAYGAVIGTPIDVYAQYGDLDDVPERVRLAWTAFSPAQVAFTLTELPAPVDPDPGLRQAGRRLLPTSLGEWHVRVIATDANGATTEELITVTVGEDQPPCLGALDPTVLDGAIPLTAPRLFEVTRVIDDLDVYPEPASDDPYLGAAELAWSIKRPGASARQALGGGGAIALDPAAFDPGVLELRVEAFDRNRNPVNCPDAAPTCAIVPNLPGCLQRQTWQLEIR